jgi:hypothetical protein
MHLKSVGYTDAALLPTIGNALNVQSPDIGKPDIYRRKYKVSRQPISVIFGHPDKILLQHLNFYADRYRAYQGLPIVRNSTVPISYRF